MADDGVGLYPLQTTQFSARLELLLQQTASKLKDKVAGGSHTGKMASPVNYLGPVKMRTPAGRFAPIQRTDADFTRRWVFPQAKELQQLIDGYDELMTIVEPKNAYAMNAAAAAGREWDDTIIGAAFATAYTGQDAAGLTSETFDTSKFRVASTFGSSAASGMLTAKFIEAKRILRHYHNDLEMDPPYAIVGSQQESDLLNQVQIVSREFNDRPVLVDGKVTRFLGFDIVYSERLAQASSVRTCQFGVKSGQYLGTWKDVTNRTSIRDDLSSQPFQLYTNMMCGGTRLEPGKTLQVLCADTTGDDITP